MKERVGSEEVGRFRVFHARFRALQLLPFLKGSGQGLAVVLPALLDKLDWRFCGRDWGLSAENELEVLEGPGAVFGVGLDVFFLKLMEYHFLHI